MNKLSLDLTNSDNSASPATPLDLSYVEQLRAVANEAQITVSGFHTNTELELYFDFSSDDESSGYIYKGWDDPGVRIADLVNITPPAFDDLLFFEYLADRCALEGVMLTRDTDEARPAWLLESGIYSTGLNAPTLVQVVRNFSKCVTLVRNACATYAFVRPPVACGEHASSLFLC